MRILSIGNFGNGWDGSICDEEHIARALEFQGHEVHRQQREDRVYDYRGIKFDFILISQWDNYAPMLIPNMKDQDGCPVVYWAFDHQDQQQEWHQRLIEGADLYLSKRIADSIYPNWQWFSQDFAPELLRTGTNLVMNEQKDIDVLFTGSYLPWADERNETLKLIDENFELSIYSVNPAEWLSRGFKHVNGPVMDDALPALVSRAKIVVSIDHTIEAGYWSDRNAQSMVCGGLVLFRYVPLSTTVFGDYIDYFHTPEQCLEKIAYWLANDHTRKLKAIDGHNYACKNLMVSNRVKELITIVEGIL